MGLSGLLLLVAMALSLGAAASHRGRPGSLPVLFRAARPLGALLGWLVGSCLRVRRGHVERSMARAGVASDRAREMYQRLGRGVFELLWLSLPGRRRLDGVVEIDPELSSLLEEGRGFVVATAHTGNWDLTACAAARMLQARDRRLLVVTKHFSHGWLDRLWQGLRRKYGVELVSAGGVWGRARHELPRGNVVAMMIDQAPERVRGSARGSFLGRPCALDLAPSLLAGRLKVPLVAVFAARDLSGRQVLRLAGSASPPNPGEPLRAWAEATTQRLNDWLGAQVRAEPADWLWMHRRWKGSPSGRDGEVLPLVRGGRAEAGSA